MLCFPLPGERPLDTNPEFLRNLRLEFSLHRVIGMPLIAGLVFLAVWLATESMDSIGAAASIMAFILLVLWGTRLSTESVMTEVENLTWDEQRLTSMTSWEMTWGKLIGSTSFIWYGALWLLPFVVLWPKDAIMGGFEMVITGVAAQATAMLFGMLFLRLKPAGLRGLATVAQITGVLLGTGVLLALFPLRDQSMDIQWYGLTFEAERFGFAALCIITSWTIAGIHHLMRSELQYADPPYVWGAFLIFAVFFNAGFAEISPWMAFETPGLATAMVVAFATSALLTELAALLEPKGFIPMRQWLARLAENHTAAARAATPCWFVSLVVSAVLCITAAAFEATTGNAQTIPTLAAILLFVIRDVGLISFFTLSGRPFSGTVTSLVYLGILYLLLPAILIFAEQPHFLSIFLPDVDVTASPVMSMTPPAVEAAITWSMLAWRWNRIRNKTFSAT